MHVGAPEGCGRPMGPRGPVIACLASGDWDIIVKTDRSRTKRFTKQQIGRILRAGAEATNLGDVLRKYRVTDTTYYRWRRSYGQPLPPFGADARVSEADRRLRRLEAEDRRLRRLVADLAINQAAIRQPPAMPAGPAGSAGQHRGLEGWSRSPEGPSGNQNRIA